MDLLSLREFDPRSCIVDNVKEAFKSIEDELSCPICNDVLLNPYNYECKCKTPYCHHCLERYVAAQQNLKLEHKCPRCHTGSQTYSRNVHMVKLLDGCMKTRCPLKACGWKGGIHDLLDHLKTSKTESHLYCSCGKVVPYEVVESHKKNCISSLPRIHGDTDSFFVRMEEAKEVTNKTMDDRGSSTSLTVQEEQEGFRFTICGSYVMPAPFGWEHSTKPTDVTLAPPSLRTNISWEGYDPTS